MSGHELLSMGFNRGEVILSQALLHAYDKDSSEPFALLKMVLDTGATSTHISKRVLGLVGYGDSMFKLDAKESFAVVGKYTAQTCEIKRLEALGISFGKRTVKVWEPPAGYHIDGIVGMDLIRYFNIEINMDVQKAYINPSQATKALQAKR